MSMWTNLVFKGKNTRNLSNTHRVITIKYKGYESQVTHTAAMRARMALDCVGVNAVGPIPLPRNRKLVNVLKSPFKWKKHQELWERRTFSRLVSFETDVASSKHLLEHLYRTKYAPVGIRIKKMTFEPIEKYWKHPYLHIADLNRGYRLPSLRQSIGVKRPSNKHYGQRLLAKIHHVDADGVWEEQTKHFHPLHAPTVDEIEIDDEIIKEEILLGDKNIRGKWFEDPKIARYEHHLQNKINNFITLTREKLTGDKIDINVWKEIVDESKKSIKRPGLPKNKKPKAQKIQKHDYRD